ncbi:MAG: hypothetical protein ICV68_11530 [Pyrinomonadaceae bacterium]|nr:hypothetical protein [Pyrinomonadaceae bacterium]
MLKKSFEIAFLRFALAGTAALMLLVPSATNAQQSAQVPATTQQSQTPATDQKTVATQTNTVTKQMPSAEPLYREYRGVSVGMSVDEVRGKLGKPEEMFDEFDIFVFSDKERARVYYDKDKKARAISITYIGTNGGAPLPVAVLGTEIESKADGSMHKMVTYPEAGYWLSYSRTAGDNPLVMITMQKTP